MNIADNRQQAIIEMHGRSALVLAGPGCGKTHILARRIFHANAVLGVDFEHMLCLTFTNRAAREMALRVESYIGNRPKELFIGNIHRFCLKFLYENGLLSPDTSVLDETDRDDFFNATLLLKRSADVNEFLSQVNYLYQASHDHPEYLIRRPQRMPDSAAFERIEQYVAFKEENKLVDFDEILLRTYTALLSPDYRDYKYTGYRWLQVDEVQDITPLQLAIIERITVGHGLTALYLGDEQQAIFSFLGAGRNVLETIKNKCSGNIIHLQRNYRSPRYLVELCNALATKWLEIDDEFLPQALSDGDTARPLIAYSGNTYALENTAADIAQRWLNENPDQDVMILVRTNAEGDSVSEALRSRSIEHFHISRQDVFHQTTFKTIWAHLSVVNNPRQWHSWARLLYATGATKTLKGARDIVGKLREAGISADELLIPGKATILQRFMQLVTAEDTDIVVLDTETTGLDIFNDDVIQISAVRYRGGKVVPGSAFEIFIDSHRPLPLTLADGQPNPLCSIYSAATRYTPADALTIFADYLGNATVAGHNIDFDIEILRNNIERYTTITMPAGLMEDADSIDTLAVAQLVMPRLRSHTLAALIDEFGLTGTNSHNATDDVAATAELLTALTPRVLAKLPAIGAAQASPTLQRIQQRFCERYGPFYQECRHDMHKPVSSLAEAVDVAHAFFTSYVDCTPIEHFDYMLRLIDRNIVDEEATPHFREQVQRHLYDLLTYHESDLFGAGIVRERLSVMTIHKAKGLEAENVILFNATTYFNDINENARLLYVAFSRARRRLAVGMSHRGSDIIESLRKHFYYLK